MAKELNPTTIDTTPASDNDAIKALMRDIEADNLKRTEKLRKLAQAQEKQSYIAKLACGEALPEAKVNQYIKAVAQEFGNTDTFTLAGRIGEAVGSLEDFKAALKIARDKEALPRETVRAIITVQLLKHKKAYRTSDNFDATTGKAVSKDASGKPSALYMQVRRILEASDPETSKQKAAKPEKTVRERLETFMGTYSSDATIAALVELFGKAQLLALIDACKDSAADVEEHVAKVAAERGKGKTKPAKIAQPA